MILTEINRSQKRPLVRPFLRPFRSPRPPGSREGPEPLRGPTRRLLRGPAGSHRSGPARAEPADVSGSSTLGSSGVPAWAGLDPGPLRRPTRHLRVGVRGRNVSPSRSPRGSNPRGAGSRSRTAAQTLRGEGGGGGRGRGPRLGGAGDRRRKSASPLVPSSPLVRVGLRCGPEPHAPQGR